MSIENHRRSNRRDFLRTASVGAAAVGFWTSRSVAASQAANEKLNVGCVGVANRATSNVNGVSGENIVALCDIDDNFLNAAAKRHSKAKRYNDFRKMLEQKNIDAVVVSTADHVHAPASVGAMKLGKHVYCEKPLTHSVYEARVCAETAKKMKVATQMGTQIHAGENYRRVVEIIRSGAIGDVTEVHSWVGKAWGGGERPKGSRPVPKHLHWDLWLGPAPERPYYPGVYHPANWRRWWDFGGGTLGDMACHIMDLPFWALELRHPLTVEAVGPEPHPETCPTGLVIHYTFPRGEGKEPLKLTWHDGSKRPRTLAGHSMPGMGSLFIGTKGQLFSDYGRYKLYPEAEFKDFKPPKQTIPRSIGHYAEWIKACKDGSPTTCNFDYSGALTEAVLLGNVAYRTGEKLKWDGKELKATNTDKAAQFVRREYRKGWTL